MSAIKDKINFNIEDQSTDAKKSLPDDKGVSRALPNEWTASRVTSIVLPFISLYKPAGKVISITSTLVCSVNNCYYAKNKSYAFFTLTMSVVKVAGSIFSYQQAILFSTAVDILFTLKKCKDHLSEEEYLKLCKDIMEIISLVISGVMTINSPIGFRVASFALKATLRFVQALEEGRKEGRHVEMAAHLLLGVINLYKANEQYEIHVAKIAEKKRIQRELVRKKIENLRNKVFYAQAQLQDQKLKLSQKISLLQTEKEVLLKEFQDLLALKQAQIDKVQQITQFVEGLDMKMGHFVPFSDDNPFSYLSSFVEEKKVVYIDDKGMSHDFGAHFSKMGGALVKGMNICVRDMDTHFKVEFKLNHVFRDELASKIEIFEDVLRGDKTPFIASQMDIEERQQFYAKQDKEFLFNAFDISIVFRENQEMLNSYDTVEVKVSKEFGDIYTGAMLQGVLSIFDLEGALQFSTEEEIKRMKLGHLFHVFCPREAIKLERQREFFTLSLDALKSKMIQMNTSMGGFLKRFLPSIKFEEIFPGRERLRIHGLVDFIEEEVGPIHLTAAMVGVKSVDIGGPRLDSIMQIGFCSLEQRMNAGVHAKGLIYDDDYLGANDEVFTQLVTTQKSYNEFSYGYYGLNYRLLISPDILEFGTYQYHYDTFGSKKMNDTWFDEEYTDRDSIIEFVKSEYETKHSANEVMSKDFIHPKYIVGVMVPNEGEREKVVEYLVDKELFSKEKALKFVRVGINVDHESIKV